MESWRRPGINAGWTAALLTLLVGAVALWQLNATLVVARTTEHIGTTLDTLQDVLSRLKDAETGQRGFVITGDTAYLAPYRVAVAGLQEDINALRRLTENEPANRRSVGQVEPFIQRRLAEIDTTIRLRRAEGFESSARVIRTNAGKSSMDSVRAVIAELGTVEQVRLVTARGRQHDSVRVAVFVILGGSLAAFALALLAQGFVRTAAARLRRTAAELSAANSELEVKTRAANAASQAKSDFLAVMSHELRTPLNAILGHAGLLLDGIVGPVAPQQTSSLRRIQKAAHSLVSLIDEILGYARLGRGNETVELRNTELGELVGDVVGMVEHIFGAKGLALRYQQPEIPCFVNTDGPKVAHILLNLLTNAAKFTASGTVTVTVQTASGHVIVAVGDTGVGLSADDQRRVFDAFTQADGRRSRAAEGAGLGLTIARRLARLLGGDLTVESELNRGSVFTLTLPVDKTPSMTDSDALSSAAIFANR